jgi:hypothetical protein
VQKILHLWKTTAKSTPNTVDATTCGIHNNNG